MYPSAWAYRTKTFTIGYVLPKSSKVWGEEKLQRSGRRLRVSRLNSITRWPGSRFLTSRTKGTSPARVALTTGQVNMLFDAMGNQMPNIRAGKARVLAVTDEKRSPLLPGIPTVSEVLPGFVSIIWTGVVAPPKTPLAIAEKLSAAIAEAMKDPDIVKFIAQQSGADAACLMPGELR